MSKNSIEEKLTFSLSFLSSWRIYREILSSKRLFWPRPTTCWKTNFGNVINNLFHFDSRRQKTTNVDDPKNIFRDFFPFQFSAAINSFSRVLIVKTRMKHSTIAKRVLQPLLPVQRCHNCPSPRTTISSSCFSCESSGLKSIIAWDDSSSRHRRRFLADWALSTM